MILKEGKLERIRRNGRFETVQESKKTAFRR
jgi:hypothetical protein